MGIYNCASTLDEALESLYNQTFQDFQIILCEDGSSDNTYEVAKKHANSHNNIILIRNPYNMGLNATLNRCLALADTELIARMDGDDISKPERFATQVAFLDAHPEYGVVSTPGTYFDENGIFRVGHGRGEVKKKHFIRSSPVGHAECMARTEVFKAVGGYTESDRLLRVEDYHLWFKIFAAGFRMYMMPNSLYMVRSDAASIGRRNWRNRKNEAYVKHIGFNIIGLPFYYQIFALEPIIKYLLPRKLYTYFFRRKS